MLLLLAKTPPSWFMSAKLWSYFKNYVEHKLTSESTNICGLNLILKLNVSIWLLISSLRNLKTVHVLWLSLSLTLLLVCVQHNFDPKTLLEVMRYLLHHTLTRMRHATMCISLILIIFIMTWFTLEFICLSFLCFCRINFHLESLIFYVVVVLDTSIIVDVY